jgi:hypothetical protein
MSFSKSIHTEVPVNPVCPTLLEEKWLPELEFFPAGVSHPMAQAEPGTISCLEKNALTVSVLMGSEQCP